MLKKKWKKPQLTVLTTVYPEESVLGVCKGGSAGDPENVQNDCNADIECNECWGGGST
jgi:hypothetical protein